jgi:hypothetical protein
MPGFVAAMCSLLDSNKQLNTGLLASTTSCVSPIVIIGHQARRALILDETRTPMMKDDDVAFQKFRELATEAGFYIKELGKRESPGFPGPLYMFACAREERYMEDIPLAFVNEEEEVGRQDENSSII